MNKEEFKLVLEEVKTLVLIGGLPCLVFLLMLILSQFIFPNNIYAGSILTAIGVGFAAFVSIVITSKRIINLIEMIKKQ